VQIETPSGIVNGVNQYRSDADDIGGLFDARQRVKQQSLVESLSMIC